MLPRLAPCHTNYRSLQFFGSDELFRAIGFGVWPCFKVGELCFNASKDCLGKQNERLKTIRLRTVRIAKRVAVLRVSCR